MPRVSITLPEELKAGSEPGRQTNESTRSEFDVDARADGAGEPTPVIVRWFATWASGEVEAAVGSP